MAEVKSLKTSVESECEEAEEVSDLETQSSKRAQKNLRKRKQMTAAGSEQDVNQSENEQMNQTTESDLLPLESLKASISQQLSESSTFEGELTSPVSWFFKVKSGVVETSVLLKIL